MAQKQSEDSNSLALIDQLPDELLVLVLSQLTLEEAIATSILSKRWRYLWTSYSNLNLDVEKILTTKYKQPDFSQLFTTTIERNKRLRRRERARYIRWVNSVLRQHTGPSIDQLRICCYLDKNFARSITQWIELALSKRIQRLELDFSKNNLFHQAYKRHYAFLDNNFCGSQYVGLRSLKSLVLMDAVMSEEVLEDILSSCPVLENLDLRYMRNHDKSLVNLRVSGPTLPLKHLAICGCWDIQNIEICDSKLVSFRYGGPCTRLLFKNVPALSEVELAVGLYRLKDYARLLLSSGLSHLKKLTINVGRIMAEDAEFHVFPKFPRLKLLMLQMFIFYDYSLDWISSFIEACPNLEKIVLKCECASIRERDLMSIKCPHQHLKAVEFDGYSGATHDFELAMYFIENAESLQKLIIDPRCSWRDIKVEQRARNHAERQFEGRVPSRIELVIL